MPPNQDYYDIVFRVDRNKAYSEILEIEKRMKQMGAEMFGAQGFSVGPWQKMKEGIDPLIASLNRLKKQYEEIAPKVQAAVAIFNRLGKEAIKQAQAIERLRNAQLRAKIQTQQIALNQDRLAMSTVKLSQAYVQHETAIKRDALAAANLERAQIRLRLEMEAFNSSKDREMMRLAKNENLLLRNALMQERLSGAVGGSSAAVSRFRLILRSMAEQYAWVEKLLSKFAQFSPVISKAISKAQAFGSAIRRAVTAPIRGIQRMFSGFTGLIAKLGIIVSLAYTMRMAWRAVVDIWSLGIQTLDTLQLKAASMAGAMLIADPGMAFSDALAQADQLLLKSFALSREFVGSARELQVLMEAMATFGVRMDLETERGRKAFVAFANTLKLITQGQNFEIQAFQEIRALMQGQNFQGAMLARRMQALGIDVKKMVPIWTEQGILLEKIVELMGGYAQATEAIKNTLYSQRKLTESIVALILKEGLQQAYDEIKATLISINWSLLGNVELTDKALGYSQKIRDWWIKIRNAFIELLPYIMAFGNIMRDVWNVQKWILDKILGFLGLIGRAIKFLWDNLAVPPSMRKSVEDYFNEISAGGFKTAADLKMMFDEMDRDWHARRARQAQFIYDAEGKAIGIKYERAKAESPSAVHTPMETEARNFAERIQSFIDKTRRGMVASVGKMGDNIAQKVISARNKVIDEFAKFFDHQHWAGVERKMPELAAALKGLQIEKLAETETTALREWRIEMTRDVVKLNHSLDQLFDQHLQEYDDVDDGLTKKYRQIDKTMNDEIFNLQQTLKKFTDIGSLDEEGGMASLPAQLLRELPLVTQMFEELIARAEDYRDRMKELAKAQYLREHGAYVRAIHENLDNLINAARIPVKWSWNEDEIERAGKLADNIEKIGKEREKLAKDYSRNKLTTAEYLAAWEKTEVALKEMNERVIEETKFTTKVASEAWGEFFAGVGTVSKSFFSDIFKAELKTFGDYWMAFTDMLLDVWSNMLSKMVQKWVESLMGDQLQEVFSGFANLFKGALNIASPLKTPLTEIGARDAFYGYGFKEGGVLPGQFVPIRAFQHGGIASRPTLGLIGEGGSSEAVIPLKGGKVPVDIRGRGGDTQNINVTFAINAVDAKGIDRLLYERRNMITGMIRQEIRNAGGTRDVIRRHTF